MNPNLFAICITVLAICFGAYIRDFMVEYQKEQYVRALAQLQQQVSPYLRRESAPQVRRKL